ncbi:hypothetical protein KFK09_009235 [Dendrobium nobile]|uniref:BTB domain-containing protein n=1 Tax=Dendrobium nobile TaxID=94219 RepID=A0A8T3BQ70_DENNO|nr:hypothetical protein KFK09_009235 [Dendrobium nobile]
MEEKIYSSPKAPPFLGLNARRSARRRTAGLAGGCIVSKSTRDIWDRLFKEGYKAGVIVRTSSGIIPAHASVLGMASPVIEQMVRQFKSQSRSRKKPISIGDVSHRAVHVFLRFLYSCYED